MGGIVGGCLALAVYRPTGIVDAASRLASSCGCSYLFTGLLSVFLGTKLGDSENHDWPLASAGLIGFVCWWVLSWSGRVLGKLSQADNPWMAIKESFLKKKSDD